MDLNNGHYPWAQWQPAQYISAYRHFVDRCRVSSPKSQFVWSPRGEENLEGFYPGDEYVDDIGLSVFGYQEYEIAISGRTVNIASLVRSTYDRVKRYH